MLNAPFIEAFLRQPAPDGMAAAVGQFLPEGSATAQRVDVIEAALRSPSGPMLRRAIGRWIVEQMVPVEALVPEAYIRWRTPVRDAMLFVVSRLSDARLAPKLLEQAELPLDTPPEARLLRLIAKVPGLQKLGQVLARNRHLGPALREALSELENGIRDVSPQEICAIIEHELGPKLQSFGVEIEPAILSEASVSAVVRFSWRNPDDGERKRGVFKVLKPHIPVYFREDMDLLHELAKLFGSRHREYGFAEHVLTDTFNKVRRLLQHETDFLREQRTLLEASALYRSVSGVRVPQVIRSLCTPRMTALSEEYGTKVTTAVAHMPRWRRGRVAAQLVDALIAAPLLAAKESSLFHADPHAGNLLYNRQTGELIILDWALTERLSRDQRRHLALLVFKVGLRDPVGTGDEIQALRQVSAQGSTQHSQAIRDCVARFFDELPLTRVPGAVDAMRLLEQVAVEGIRFPAPLIMFSKALFTLDGILNDIRGSGVSTNIAVAQHLLRRWLTNGLVLGSPLTMSDWIALQCSASLLGLRIGVKLQESVLDRLLPIRAVPTESVAST